MARRGDEGMSGGQDECAPCASSEMAQEFLTNGGPFYMPTTLTPKEQGEPALAAEETKR